ncbi:MAG: Trm112 family protein [Alphaproteobacteria bacterium]|nr:Trm112 family protein [Alphaproteobacteria bacterium]MBV9372242.1 Trm112 family protein [Alphaproteobacteria bacterium]MBV9901647.1 Trm112 family protein [Alphaproteobacteria bacterium]
MTRPLDSLLVCPLTRTPLRRDEAAEALVSDSAGLSYPVRGGIPVMLAEEARRLDSEAAQQ